MKMIKTLSLYIISMIPYLASSLILFLHLHIVNQLLLAK